MKRLCKGLIKQKLTRRNTLGGQRTEASFYSKSLSTGKKISSAESGKDFSVVV